MSDVTVNQPYGTPTWIDLGIPDIHRAVDFYGTVFGWEFDIGPAEYGFYTVCLLRGRRVAALSQPPELGETHWWNVYLAADDCDAAAERITAAGGSVIMPPMDIMSQGRMAMAIDPTGAQFGLWQGRDLVGCETVNEPGALVRNDLVTPHPVDGRDFYATVFDFTSDGNPDLPGADFTFLRRPDGHEIGGVLGVADASASAWNTVFEVADTDTVVRTATDAGGTCAYVDDAPYGRIATLHDPFGAEFSVIARPH